MSKFDAQTVQLSGINLIEASAGTGKTYTLAELYCRLVIEQQLEVSQILVVTYTRAATEELKGRLRQRLVDARKRLIQENGDGRHREALLRLKLAIQSFDEAAIYTIHGFCQRVLQDFAFESGYQFDVEMVTDEQALKQAVVDDFWRRHVSVANSAFARYLLNEHETPETLLASVDSLIGKPYVELLPIPVKVPVETVQQTFEQDFQRVQSLWQTEREQAVELFTQSDVLNGNKYRRTSVPLWIAQMDALVLAAPDVNLFEKFENFTQSKLQEAVKKGKILPELSLWLACEALFDSAKQLRLGYEQALQQLRIDLTTYLRTTLPIRKSTLRVQAFDDLLLKLQKALQGEHGSVLAAKIRQQFPAALIDEFQDTDPIQYDCFQRIFSGDDAPVFFVGDPKQAIYSFRGADIYTYLQAKTAANHEFTLDTNWRSHPQLVQVINQLFARIDNPFLNEAIPFVPVKAGQENVERLLIQSSMPEPLAFTWLDADESPLSGGKMSAFAVAETANQIVEYLNFSQLGQATLTDKTGETRAINGGDIAVLVRSHKQAALVQKALKKRGVNSVLQSNDSVFASEEATMLQHVLAAVHLPRQDQLVATALATPVFGLSALEIYQLQQDEMAWLKQTDFFVDLHDTWQQHGFVVMFRSLMTTANVQARWLQTEMGERQVTNLLHLAELLQQQSRRQASLSSLLTWFAEQCKIIEKGSDVAQIRLESDEQLVKIMTIHTSKGLEYPIVFCPFLWHVGKPKQKPKVVTFHREESQAVYAAFSQPVLDEASEQADKEAFAEDLRLLYVALTRARERCVILWGATSTTTKSALGRLLHSQSEKVDAANLLADLQAFSTEHAPLVALNRVSQADTENMLTVQSADTVLAPRYFHGHIAKPWSVGSFSGLSQGHHNDLPDHDSLPVPTVLSVLPVKTMPIWDRFYFPKGAQAGSCLHALFEHWDFQQDDDIRLQQIAKTLAQFGINAEWCQVAHTWLKEVVATPLSQDDRLTLNNLSLQQRLDEMAFYFSVNALTVKQLKAVLQDFSDEIPELANVALTLNFRSLSGFMKGFVDLIFEQNGRFYIVDYKSNWLGDGYDHYHDAAIKTAMVSHAYPLQYLIYSVALHRYLRLRLPDYDPEQHLGGVFYLFIRGMHPEQPGSGIYHARPSVALVEALDDCMMAVDDE